MNKWWWFAGGVLAGYFVAPKLVAWVPFKLPGGGR